MSAGCTLSSLPPDPLTPPMQDVIFYGASRFEAPEVGLKFRRERGVFQVKSVRGERSPLRDFARAWKFIATCERVSDR